MKKTDIYVSLSFDTMLGGHEHLDLVYSDYYSLYKTLYNLQEDDLINLSYIHVSNVPSMLSKQMTCFVYNFLKIKFINNNLQECIEDIKHFERKKND